MRLKTNITGYTDCHVPNAQQFLGVFCQTIENQIITVAFHKYAGCHTRSDIKFKMNA